VWQIVAENWKQHLNHKNILKMMGRLLWGKNGDVPGDY